jgi:hypothetical protein
LSRDRTQSYSRVVEAHRCPETPSTGWIFHPDLALHGISGINPLFVVSLNPVPIFMVPRNPDPFSFLRNPLSVDLPVARWSMYHRWAMVDRSSESLLGKDNWQWVSVLEEIIEGYRPESDGYSLPSSALSISPIGDRCQGENHHKNQPYGCPPFHKKITSLLFMSHEKVSIPRAQRSREEF